MIGRIERHYYWVLFELKKNCQRKQRRYIDFLRFKFNLTIEIVEIGIRMLNIKFGVSWRWFVSILKQNMMINFYTMIMVAARILCTIMMICHDFCTLIMATVRISWSIAQNYSNCQNFVADWPKNTATIYTLCDLHNL